VFFTRRKRISVWRNVERRCGKGKSAYFSRLLSRFVGMNIGISVKSAEIRRLFCVFGKDKWEGGIGSRSITHHARRTVSCVIPLVQRKQNRETVESRVARGTTDSSFVSCRQADRFFTYNDSPDHWLLATLFDFCDTLRVDRKI